MSKHSRAACVLLTLCLYTPVRADVIWTERNAGSLPATAEVVTGTINGEALVQINGVFNTIGNADNADLFQIFISDPARFSATTVGQLGTLSNTQLYLFDANGLGVYFNDDANAATQRSTLPAGSPLGPQTAGQYYLLITPFDWNPVGTGGRPIFQRATGADHTGVFGPVLYTGQRIPVEGYVQGPGGLPAAGSYTYSISLTGASPSVITPEPASVLTMAIGLAGLAAAGWRRRRG